MRLLNRYWLLVVGCWLLAAGAQAQMVRAGKISFERKTNLHKKFPDEETRRWIGKEKYRYDNFVLYFNDTMSVFVFEDSPSSGRGDWATVKNNHITFLNQGIRHSLLNIMGEEAVIVDAVKRRPFKRLGKKREIAGYKCQMVRFDQDDSTRLYAWYSDAIIPSVGPETYMGLPGAILGLATEDGGVVYFATKVEVLNPDFKAVTPKYKTNKAMTEEEVRKMLLEKMSGSPWASMVLKELFMW
jgi:GLPGLI family protein